jgi:aminoglycoside phosphotransferase (APT) family kinase protein
MTEAWSAERVVSVDLAHALVEAQFPSLAPVRVQSFGAGWDNTAFVINDTYVFRFPRRQVAVSLIETEARLLPAIASRLPLPVPVPGFVGRPSERYPWPFAGYRMLPGHDGSAINPDDERRADAAVSLGRFLAALHAIPPAEAAALSAGPDPLSRLDPVRRVPRARTELDQLARAGVIHDVHRLAAVLDAAPLTYVARNDTLVHGDLYAGNLLVDETGRLTGVIDWGDMHLGDPASDLMIAHTFLPPAAHAAFQQAYGGVADLTWRMARQRALWHTLTDLVYAHSTGDADTLRECRRALHYLASAPTSSPSAP